MFRISRLDILIWLPRLVFFVVLAIFFNKYFTYLNAVIPFPYDWEPTDGDHLNFAHRIAQGFAIYLPMKDGQVLSIYNPLYHAFVALVGGVHSTLGFAREVSLLFWLLIPLVVFWYLIRKWGFFYSSLAALFIFLPAEKWMLIDIVQVGPNSTMAFIFVVTLLFAEKCVEKKNTGWWSWLLLGIIGALCYLAKQQGIIAIAVISVFFIFQRVCWRNIAMTMLGFFLLFMVSAYYLEFVNSGGYLRATLFDLHQIMDPNFHLAKTRLIEFLLAANFSFLICIAYSFYIFILGQAKLRLLTIWQVSFILHIPFLLAILGNGGGGPNYFLTIWISIVLLCLETVKKTESSCSIIAKVNIKKLVMIFLILALWGKSYHLHYALIACSAILIFFVALVPRGGRVDLIVSNLTSNTKSKDEGRQFIFANLLLVTLFVNIYIGIVETIRTLDKITLPNQSLEYKMQDYYQAISQLVSNKAASKVLTNRNIGALVFNDVVVENEGATMFSYAWNAPNIFNRDLILKSIQENKFDFITTGIQEYPEEVKIEIEKYYRPAFTKEINLYFGSVGVVTVFVPKDNIL
jgi:hypothetical protein